MINWDRVNELRNDIGADDFDDIVDIFLDEVEEIACNLRDASDAKAIEMHLHALKNGALNLGFSDLSGLCQTGEGLAKSNRVEEVDIHKIRATLTASLDQFRAELPAITEGQ